MTERAITGRLEYWRKVHYGDKFKITGNIYGDVNLRFADGQEVTTSLVTDIDGDIASTLNSTYRLVGEELEPITIY